MGDKNAKSKAPLEYFNIAEFNRGQSSKLIRGLIADLLRDDYKQSDYGDVIFPFTVLSCLDSVLTPTNDKVLELNKTLQYKNKAPFL